MRTQLAPATISEVKIAYVVPTKDRPDDLRLLFKSLRHQTVQPNQIVVVDGSDPSVEFVCSDFPDLNITYIRVFPPSLAKQRNAGMEALCDDITHAGYLDDDLELDPDATNNIVKFWENATESTGGVSMNIVNQPKIRHYLFHRFFLMTGRKPGGVTISGFQCPIPTVSETIETRWLYGGATIWKRAVIDEYSYDEWFSGHGLGEDYEYSYRVGRKYRLFVCADARTLHHTGEMDPAKMYALGRQQVYNRFYMFRVMGDFSAVLFGWSIAGLIFQTSISALRPRNSGSRERLRGNLRGLIEGIKGTKTSFHAYWKN